MMFRQLFDSVSCTYTYLLASPEKKEALIIDPVKEHLPTYLQLLKELDLKLMMAVDTHTHADHITATGSLMKELACDIVMGEYSKADCVSIHVREGDLIQLGDIKLRAIYTPGHTDDSYSFIGKDRVFTGDTLLIRATGRTDFQNGDAAAQYDSLFNKILKLPDDMFVYPAHNYKGITRSTIYEEKNFNPRLQVKSKTEYVELMNNLHLDLPKMIEIAVPANLHCGLI